MRIPEDVRLDINERIRNLRFPSHYRSYRVLENAFKNPLTLKAADRQFMLTRLLTYVLHDGPDLDKPVFDHKEILDCITQLQNIMRRVTDNSSVLTESERERLYYDTLAIMIDGERFLLIHTFHILSTRCFISLLNTALLPNGAWHRTCPLTQQSGL